MGEAIKNKMANRRFKAIYPWIAIIVSAFFLFYKYILQVYPGIMQNDLMRAFHVHGAGLGNLAAAAFYSYVITQLFAGVLLDKYSPRYLSAIALAIAAFGTYIFSVAHTLTLAAFGRTLMGIGIGFATVSYMKIAAMWFRPNQFAFVGGLLATAAMLGAMFGEAPLSLIVDIEGWRMSLFLCSLLGFLIAILFVIVIRDKHTSEAFEHHGPSGRVTIKDVVTVLRKKQNWLLMFYSGLAFSPVAVFGGLWGNTFLQQVHHIGRTGSATLIMMIFAGLALGGPFLGLISDFFQNRKKVMFIGCLLSLVTLTMVIYIDSLPIWSVVALLFLYGFGTGAFMLGFAVGKEINKVLLAATVIGLINTGDAVFGAITDPIVGKFLDLGWSGKILNGVHFFTIHDYHQALMILPAYLLTACILIFFIKETHGRNLPGRK